MGALLLCAGCTGLPGRISVDVDGRRIELRQQGFDYEQINGRWSLSQDCSSLLKALPEDVAAVRRNANGNIEIVSPNGTVATLYPCPR
jgi:hypothetical protein